MGIGDCEGKAILLITLLRSDPINIPPWKVRVVAGMLGGGPPTPSIYYPDN